ncbi:MAG: M35 family metallo-endopeptidase [Candidatus Polarisedimenticolaceae bacterium]|nr:M35 family metallo-endopeptidase [Candidatus Polarisedimenticolaceae bacterium]
MDSYTDMVYKKARDIFGSQEYAPEWQKFLDSNVHPISILTPDGPAKAHAGGLSKLRRKLIEVASGAESGKVIVAAAENTTSIGSWQERAAALKMLKHTYRAHKRGGQDVWVYSPPHAYSKWIFSELTGSKASVTLSLDDNKEVYSMNDRRHMCEALQVGMICSQKVEIKLANPDATTTALVRLWFADQETTDDQIKQFIPKLLAGFKKITNVCNASTLLFTSDPSYRKDDDRFQRTRGAVFPGGEGKFPVIYLEGAFMEMGNSGQIWKCAKTIVHEASHHEVRTKDNARDSTGLKPDRDRFPHAKAIDNADSWAYFALNINGKLSASDRNEVLKAWT